MSTLRMLPWLALAALSSCLAEEAALPEPVREHIISTSDRLGSQLMASFLALDDDDDGRVSLRIVLQTLMDRGFARPGGPVPKAVEESGMVERYRRRRADGDKMFVKFLDRDEAGMIGRTEVVDGFRKALTQFTSRQVPLDTDRDGKLTLREHAMSTPVRDADETDAEGFTALQREAFAMQDRDGDGFVAGEEWTAGIVERVEEWTETTWLTMVIDQADKDADGILSRSELTTLLPDASEGLPEQVSMEESLYWIRELPHGDRHQLAAVLAPDSTSASSPGPQWSNPAVVRYGGLVVLRYRAAILGQTLVVEAKHSRGWHSYAMDNVARAKAEGGEDAECEMPTVITLGNGVVLLGTWRQSKLKDLSKPDQSWHTWGFEDTVVFTRKLAQWPETGFSITINAQVCNAEACAMAKDLVIDVPHETVSAAVPELDPVLAFPLTETQKLRVQKMIADDPGQLPRNIAATIGVPEAAVVEALPDKMRVAITADQFDAVWSRLCEWEKPMTILQASGSIFEIKGRLAGGTYGRGYFNIGSDDAALHGHLRPDVLASIYLIKKPFHGRPTCQCAFYDKAGNRVFSVYVDRDDAGQMDVPTQKVFQSMWKAHR